MWPRLLALLEVSQEPGAQGIEGVIRCSIKLAARAINKPEGRSLLRSFCIYFHVIQGAKALEQGRRRIG